MDEESGSLERSRKRAMWLESLGQSRRFKLPKAVTTKRNRFRLAWHNDHVWTSSRLDTHQHRLRRDFLLITVSISIQSVPYPVVSLFHRSIDHP